MDTALTTLRIQNFKSLKDVTLHPRRVNLLIGKPNAGKSNLLEAISLLGGVAYGTSLADFMRFEHVRNLFYDNAVTERLVSVESNLGLAGLSYEPGEMRLAYLGQSGSEWLQATHEWEDYATLSVRDILKMSNVTEALLTQVDAAGKFTSPFKGNVAAQPVKKYAFKTEKQNQYLPVNEDFLWPPFGGNLIDVLQRHRPLRQEVAGFFKENGLQLLFRTEENKLEIQKVMDDASYTYPYSSVADTLQRIIFYLAAIESNTNSILLFEEPEAHTFPVYTSLLGQRVVNSANQFFIATHSQYLTNEILDTMLRHDTQATEVGVFLVYFEEYETKVKQLTDEEMRQLMGQQDTRLDMFLNLSRFAPGPNLYA